jgi:hypothetical protein
MEKSREQIETERTERVLSTKKEVNKNPLTWRDVKDLANSLTEEQLQQPVNYWTESEGGTVGDANVLDEDYVSDGEAYAPKSEMPAEAVDEDEPVFPKGTVMIWII